MSKLFVVVVCFILLVLPVVGVSATQYATHAFIWDAVNGMRDIGMLGTGSTAKKVNDSGQVIGQWSTPDSPYRAFYWDEETGMIDLGTGGGVNAYAWGINNSGQVVGSITMPDFTNRAFIWDKINGIQFLGNLGGNRSWAYGINDLGQVVGDSVTADGSWNAFIWDNTSGMRDLGFVGRANDINNNGEIVGYAEGYRAFYWNQTDGFSYLHPDKYMSSALSINSSGQAVGWIDNAPATHYISNGFFWDKTTGSLVIGEPWQDPGGSAYDINDKGQVVGSTVNNQAYIWTTAGGFQYIGTLPGGTISGAGGISNTGYVVGGVDMPVPEPSSLLALGVGIAGFYAGKRRRE